MSKLTTVFTLLVTLGLSGNAMADHNSPFGEGWARDAQDRHSDAVERLDSVGNDREAAMERENEMEVSPPTQRPFETMDELVTGRDNDADRTERDELESTLVVMPFEAME
ncbi:MAG: hypothetical protein OQK73_12265 [Gammaproteobacteria bacterium]|nr:hypothetical protein [Gammaproteobacteria bacterium]